MNAPSIDDVVKHLRQLRETLAHAIKSGNLRPDRFNDATAQVRALDNELLKLGIKPAAMSKGKPRTAPFGGRANRRAAKRSQGNTLEQRIKDKAERKRIAEIHGCAIEDVERV